MFVLSEAIGEFNKNHNLAESSEITLNKEMLSDLFKIESSVIANGNSKDVEAFESFKSELLGENPEIEEDKASSPKAEAAKNKDLLNKIEREAEQSRIVAAHLKEQNENLLAELNAAKEAKESSIKLVASLVKKTEEISAQLESEVSSKDSEKDAIVKEMKEMAIKAVTDVQEVAKGVILEKEMQLETAIQIASTITDHFFAQQAINECLVERLNSSTEIQIKEEKSVLTKESKLESAPTQKSNWRRF